MKHLFIGAHGDDIELSCGGFIHRLIQEGNEVTCLALSDCEVSELQQEMSESMEVLGVKHFLLANFERRIFSENRQKILDYLIQIKFQNGPFDVVVTHDSNDKHQDHSVVGQESLRAFPDKTLLTYCSPFNSLSLNENYFVKLNAENLNKKIDALYCYKSQNQRAYMNEDVIKSQAIFRGLQARVKFAEGFKLTHSTVLWKD